jgi:hypothetical protein
MSKTKDPLINGIVQRLEIVSSKRSELTSCESPIIAGIQNILSKQMGSSNLLNNARATLNALASLRN